MSDGEKRCGLASLLPMSCRGRAEAFARRLHSRLRSLGSHDDDSCASESSWLASGDKAPPPVTSLQPRHASDPDLFMDLCVFDAPGSPEEELPEAELTRFITNSADNLHHHRHHASRLDECACMHVGLVKRASSVDSDSSDGLYFDPENTDLDQSVFVANHVNGLSSGESEPTDEVEADAEDDASTAPIDEGEACQPCELPSSECTVSSLSGDDEPSASLSNLDSLTDEPAESFVPALDTPPTSGWQLSYEPKRFNVNNNNVFGAIDLESLKARKGGAPPLAQDCLAEDDSDKYCSLNSLDDAPEVDNESYSSHLDIQHDLTVECPESSVPAVQVSTLEIPENGIASIADDEVSEPEACLNGDYHAQQLLQVVPECESEEERAPRVRRCSSLKTGKTPPGTPGRKKIVRFADVLGLDLADVRTFLDEVPRVPTSAYDDLPNADLSMSPLSSSPVSASPLAAAALGAAVRPGGRAPPTKTLVPLFQQPGGEPDFLERVRAQQVCLENALLQDAALLCVGGTVRVRNLDYNKSVHVRYTTDAWRSYADMQASYVPNSCDGFSDKFSFTLYAHTVAVGQRLEFAVRFQCRGSQYWDNNRGANYAFQCLPACAAAPYVPITLPDEPAWAGAAFYYEPARSVRPPSRAPAAALAVLLLACLIMYVRSVAQLASALVRP